MSKLGSKIKENCVFVSHDGGKLLLEWIYKTNSVTIGTPITVKR